MQQPEEREYWFPAKRYGWGWGFPCKWQGWAVIAVYVALVIAGIRFVPPSVEPVSFVVYVLLLSVLLTLVAWLTGEPPRWRWGDRDRR